MPGMKSGKVIPLTARGFKQGRHSWIDVDRQGFVPPMRITHTINADLTRPPDVTGLGAVVWPAHSFAPYGLPIEAGPPVQWPVGAQLQGLGLLPLAVPPVVYGLSAAAAAGALLGNWISTPNEEWNSPEFFDQAMAWMYSTIRAWDKESWKDDKCRWKTVNVSTRQKWSSFMRSFGEFYGEVGKTSQSWNAAVWGAGVRDRYIPAAKSFMRQLKDEWVPFFSDECGFKPAGGGATLEPKDDPSKKKGQNWENIAMWGALGIGAVALASIVRSLKG